MDANIERLRNKLSEAQAAAKRIDQERGRLQRELRDATHSDRRLSLAGGAARALEDYQTELTIRRVRQLEDEFVACFNRLAHKGDVLASVKIDPETLQVDLTDQSGKALRKSELSAGEKQIYAISMLWALAFIPLLKLIMKMSGRKSNAPQSKSTMSSHVAPNGDS